MTLKECIEAKYRKIIRTDWVSNTAYITIEGCFFHCLDEELYYMDTLDIISTKWEEYKDDG